MAEFQTSPEIDPQANQPTNLQWVAVAVVGLVTVCGILLFISGGAFTAFSWYSDQQAQAKETTAAATAVVTERAQSMQQASEWPLMLYDSFEDNQNEWMVGEIDDEYASIWISLEGEYRWEATAKRGFNWRVWPMSDFTTDFYLAVEAQNLGDNPEAQYGLIFRNNDDAYFYWEIIDTQYFRFFSYQNEWIELIPSTFTEAIQPGEVNRLVVVSEDDQFTFWINDQFVGQARGSFPSSGQVGVAIGLSYEGEESVIVFDNFELRTPHTAQ